MRGTSPARLGPGRSAGGVCAHKGLCPCRCSLEPFLFPHKLLLPLASSWGAMLGVGVQGPYLSICRGVAACRVSSISHVKPLIHMFTSSSDVAVIKGQGGELGTRTPR